MNGPKVAVIGAGSYFFGKPVIWNMVKSKILSGGILALVDTDPDKLKTMMELAQRAIDATGSVTKVIGSTNRGEVLQDCDFVVLSFSEKNSWYRGVDTRIAKKYGITMCSSDTIGPGGIFRAMREIPEVLAVCSDIEELCPDAWVINFINPSSVLGIALMRHAPQIKSFALCDGNHLPHAIGYYMRLAGVIEEHETQSPEMIEKFEYKIGGINHCTFMTECRYDGEDRLPVVKKTLKNYAQMERMTGPSPKAKPRLNYEYALQLMDIYGAYPTAVSHTKEYVPFFQGYGVTPNTPEPIIPFDAYNRTEEMADAWEKTKKLASGETPIEEFLSLDHGDHATDIIESMWGNLGKPFFINSANRGAITNMPEDAFVELECSVDMANGPQPKPFGDMPRGILGLQMQVLDTHELTAEAAVSCDHNILLRAMMTDPLVNNIGDARMIIKELLEIEKDILPAKWYNS
jgi:alpha-galactosidase/6-phospho-beta-glucosidase family protein